MNDRQWIDVLTQGTAAQVAAALAARPRRVNQFLSWDRPWGPEQWMPLHVAAAAGRDEAAALLLEAGVSPDCRTRFATPMHARQTPLHLGAAHGRAAVLARLLAAAAEVEVRDAANASPLWLAARGRHGAVVALLLAAGAMPDAPDLQRRTPLHAALLDPLPEEAADDELVALAQSLLDAGADPNAPCPKDAQGYTPLHRAVMLGPAARGIVQRLCRAGADPDRPDPRHGRSARALAAAHAPSLGELFPPAC